MAHEDSKLTLRIVSFLELNRRWVVELGVVSFLELDRSGIVELRIAASFELDYLFEK